MYICNDYDDKIQHLEYSIDEFISAYHSFDINGRNLINELRNAADEVCFPLDFDFHTSESKFSMIS